MLTFSTAGPGTEQVLPLPQQGAVGGDHHPETSAFPPLQYLRQVGVEEGLPHQMKIEIVSVGT